MSPLGMMITSEFLSPSGRIKDTLSRVTSCMLNLIWCYVNCTWMLVEVNIEKKKSKGGKGDFSPHARISSYGRDATNSSRTIVYCAVWSLNTSMKSCFFISPSEVLCTLFYRDGSIINHRWLKLSKSSLHGCMRHLFLLFRIKMCSWLSVNFLNVICIND